MWGVWHGVERLCSEGSPLQYLHGCLSLSSARQSSSRSSPSCRCSINRANEPAGSSSRGLAYCGQPEAAVFPLNVAPFYLKSSFSCLSQQLPGLSKLAGPDHIP